MPSGAAPFSRIALGLVMAGTAVAFSGITSAQSAAALAARPMAQAEPTATFGRSVLPGAPAAEITTAGLLPNGTLKAAAVRWGPTVAFAVTDLAGGRTTHYEGAHPQYAWSTSKLLLATQLLQDAGTPTNLDADQAEAIDLALTASDNDAASLLSQDLQQTHAGLEGTATTLTRLLRVAGDDRTFVRPGDESGTTFARTTWDVDGQAQFLASAARGCLMSPASTFYLLTHMSNVIEEQQWGLGTVGATAYKGGWGDDADDGDSPFVVRQVGINHGADGNPYVIAIAVRPADGTFDSGVALIDEVAAWLTARVEPAPAVKGCQ